MLIIPLRKINFFLLIFVSGFSSLSAQKYGLGQKTHHFDVRKFNLGFTMGMNYGDYNMTSFTPQVDEETGVRLRKVVLKGKPGFNIGLITSFKLHNNIDLRFIPSVSLEQRDFLYVMESRVDQSDSINTKNSLPVQYLVFFLISTSISATPL